MCESDVALWWVTHSQSKALAFDASRSYFLILEYLQIPGDLALLHPKEAGMPLFTSEERGSTGRMQFQSASI